MSCQNTYLNASVATLVGAAAALLLVTMMPTHASQLWTATSGPVASTVQPAQFSNVRSLRPAAVNYKQLAQQRQPTSIQALASGDSFAADSTSKVLAPIFLIASGVLLMVAAFRQLKPADDFSMTAVSAVDRQQEERRRRLAEEDRQVQERRARLAREEMELRRKMGIVTPPTPGRPAAPATAKATPVSLESGTASEWSSYRQARERAERQKAEQAKRELQERMQRLKRLESGY